MLISYVVEVVKYYLRWWRIGLSRMTRCQMLKKGGEWCTAFNISEHNIKQGYENDNSLGAANSCFIIMVGSWYYMLHQWPCSTKKVPQVQFRQASESLSISCSDCRNGTFYGPWWIFKIRERCEKMIEIRIASTMLSSSNPLYTFPFSSHQQHFYEYKECLQILLSWLGPLC